MASPFDLALPGFYTIPKVRQECPNSAGGMFLAPVRDMEWLSWYPSFYWQHAVFALALVMTAIAILMAVKPRSRSNRSKPI